LPAPFRIAPIATFGWAGKQANLDKLRPQKPAGGAAACLTVGVTDFIMRLSLPCSRRKILAKRPTPYSRAASAAEAHKAGGIGKRPWCELRQRSRQLDEAILFGSQWNRASGLGDVVRMEQADQSGQLVEPCQLLQQAAQRDDVQGSRSVDQRRVVCRISCQV